MGFGDFLSGIGGGVSDAYDWLSSNKGDNNASSDRDFINPYLQQGNPYMAANSPYKQNYGALVSMLTDRANGNGPSIAGDAYKQAASDAQSRNLTMSYGSSPGSARAAIQQMGNMNQGLATGYASARNQEMIGAGNQLTGAINSADQSQMARDKANQDAWLRMLAERLGLTKAQMGGKTNMDIIGGMVQGAGNAAGVGGSGGAGGGAGAAMAAA